MASLQVTLGGVAIDNNTKNATPTLQRTPSSSTLGSDTDLSDALEVDALMRGVGEPEATNAGSESPGGFPTSITQKRLEYYLESTVIARKTGDEEWEDMCASRARELVKALYPSGHHETIYYFRLGHLFRKHGLSKHALAAFNEIDAGVSSDLKNIRTNSGRTCFWYYKALSQLEENIFENVEELVQNGLTESNLIGGITQQQFTNVGYYILALLHALKDDKAEATFWREQLPIEYEAPGFLYSKQATSFHDIATSRKVGMRLDSGAAQLNSLDNVTEVTTQNIILQDISGLKQNVNELFDMVYVNYKELCERIKTIHTILDGNEGRDEEEVNIKQLKRVLSGQISVITGDMASKQSKELEELKNRLTYLERQALR